MAPVHLAAGRGGAGGHAGAVGGPAAPHGGVRLDNALDGTEAPVPGHGPAVTADGRMALPERLGTHGRGPRHDQHDTAGARESGRVSDTGP